jgi:hypothetical protein
MDIEECLTVEECAKIIEFGIQWLLKFECAYKNIFTQLGDIIAQVKITKTNWEKFWFKTILI